MIQAIDLNPFYSRVANDTLYHDYEKKKDLSDKRYSTKQNKVFLIPKSAPHTRGCEVVQSLGHCANKLTLKSEQWFDLRVIFILARGLSSIAVDVECTKVF